MCCGETPESSASASMKGRLVERPCEWIGLAATKLETSFDRVEEGGRAEFPAEDLPDSMVGRFKIGECSGSGWVSPASVRSRGRSGSRALPWR